MRLIKEKGAEELIQAFKLLGNENTFLFIAGDGPEYKHLKTLTSDRIHLLGQLDYAHVIALYSASDILCFPSYSEGFATSLLEAAVSSLYIISNDVGGARQLIASPLHGTLIKRDPSCYVEQLRDALTEVINDRERIKQGGRLLREQATRLYKWENTVRLIEEIFERM